MSSYPPSTLAYLLHTQLLDSFLSFSISSTSSTFTISSTDASSPLSVASLVSSTSTVQLPPISSLLTTTASTNPSDFFFSSISSCDDTPHSFSSPQRCSRHFSQSSTIFCRRKKPRRPRRPQLPLDRIGPPVRRLVHTSVYKQKTAQYIDALKLYETHLDEIIQQTTLELDNINNTIPPSKLRKFESTQSKPRHLSPLNIQIPSHSCPNYHYYFQCNTPIVHMYQSNTHSILLYLPSLFPRINSHSY